jgi:hypothetical protein
MSQHKTVPYRNSAGLRKRLTFGHLPGRRRKYLAESAILVRTFPAYTTFSYILEAQRQSFIYRYSNAWRPFSHCPPLALLSQACNSSIGCSNFLAVVTLTLSRCPAILPREMTSIPRLTKAPLALCKLRYDTFLTATAVLYMDQT